MNLLCRSGEERVGKFTVSSKKCFRILDHTADEYIVASGATLEEAFESAALAMFEVMTDTTTIHPKAMEQVEVEAEDVPALLYSWLEDLLLKFDVEGKLFSRFKIRKIETTKEGFSLNAKIWGEDYDPDKHPSRTDIKAVTYYKMAILRKEDRVIVKFVLDI